MEVPCCNLVHPLRVWKGAGRGGYMGQCMWQPPPPPKDRRRRLGRGFKMALKPWSGEVAREQPSTTSTHHGHHATRACMHAP